MSAYKNLINSWFKGSGSGTEADPYLPAMNHPTVSYVHGNLVVTSAGFALPLVTASTLAKWVIVQAYRANTGVVAVGSSGVNASPTIGIGTGITLAPGESCFIPNADLNTVYVDATISGEGVRYLAGI